MFREPALFADRQTAGRALAQGLVQYFETHRAVAAATTPKPNASSGSSRRKRDIPVVVAIPRGGIPLSRIVADELNADFDICLVRRIPSPTSKRGSSIAAVTETGDILLRQPSSWGVSRKYLQMARLAMLEDIRQRRLLYKWKAKNLHRRVVILVDDCIASGASMLAAIHTVKKFRPRRIILASPFCSSEARQRLLGKCDDIFVLHYPPTFVACAQFYVNFPPVTDIEVMDCLRSQAERIFRRDHPHPLVVEDLEEAEPLISPRYDGSRASSASVNSSSCDEETIERREDDMDDTASFRVSRAQSWAATLLSETDDEDFDENPSSLMHDDLRGRDKNQRNKDPLAERSMNRSSPSEFDSALVEQAIELAPVPE